MWSPRGKTAVYRLLLRRLTPHNWDDPSERLEPRENTRVIPPSGDYGADITNRLGFGQRLALGLEIDGSVAICCLNARVAKPMTDGYEVNTSQEQVNGAAVAQRMGVDPPSAQGWHDLLCCPGMLA